MKRAAVFDKGRFGLAPPSRPGGGEFIFGAFRKTRREKDAGPPREVVTGRLLGDPEPGRVVPDIPDEVGSGNAPRSSSVNLTFRDLGRPFRP